QNESCGQPGLKSLRYIPPSQGGSVASGPDGPRTLSATWLWYCSESRQRPGPRRSSCEAEAGASKCAPGLQPEGCPTAGRGSTQAVPPARARAAPSGREQSRIAPGAPSSGAWPAASPALRTSSRGTRPTRLQSTNEGVRATSRSPGGGDDWYPAEVVIASSNPISLRVRSVS